MRNSHSIICSVIIDRWLVCQALGLVLSLEAVYTSGVGISELMEALSGIFCPMTDFYFLVEISLRRNEGLSFN